MLYAIIVILIVFIIFNNKENKKQQEILNKKIKELEKQIAQYKEKNNQSNAEKIENNNLKKLTDVCQKEDSPNIQEVAKNIVNNSNNIIKNQENTISTQNISKIENKKKNDEGIKNKFILMTGAILIVLAAIVFLTSTWHTVPNVLKTIVIMLLAGVFIGASKIAKNVFKLEETSNTFMYIALAYLPISLFSISLFGLIGDYFSIDGDGNYLYFALCSGFLAFLYLILGKEKKQNVLFHSSMIMQLLCVIFISCCISTQISNIILGIIIYNTLATLLKEIYIRKNAKILNIYNDIYLYATFIIEILFLINGNCFFIDTISNALLIFNFYLKFKQNESYRNIIIFLTQILIFVISFLNIISDVFDIKLLEIVFYLLLATIYVIGVKNRKKQWQESTILVVNIAMIILYISTFVFGNSNFILKSYIIMWTLSISNIINYKITTRKNLFINLIPIGIFLAQLDTVLQNNLSINYLIILEMALFVLSIFNKLKEKRHNYILQIYFNTMSIVSIIMGCISNYDSMIRSTIVFILFAIIYVIGYIRNKNLKIYKFFAYFLLNIILYSILLRLNILEYSKYILFITIVIVTCLELYLKESKDEYDKIYVIVSFVISYLILNIDIDLLSFLSIFILDIIFVLYMNNKKINNNLIIIPFIALVPGVYFSNFAYIGQMNLMILVNFVLIVLTTILSFKREKINIYTIISAVYILMQIFEFGLNIYINLIIAITWSIIHLINMEKENKKFEVILYVLGLICYNNIIKDISSAISIIESITALRYLGYIIFAICITRNILKKYVADGYKAIEYIIFSVLYLSAITNYVSEIDGMIFVFMLVCIIIFSYLRKFGPIFFTSIIAVILNGFLLTREFWFSIPWWIYMLVVGSILIIFAVKNELNENKQKELLKNKIKEFKEFLDM